MNISEKQKFSLTRQVLNRDLTGLPDRLRPLSDERF
jgi:hypothetical protein